MTMSHFLVFALGLIIGGVLGLEKADRLAVAAVEDTSQRLRRSHEAVQAQFDNLCRDSVPADWRDRSERWQMTARATLEDGGCRFHALPPLATLAAEKLP